MSGKAVDIGSAQTKKSGERRNERSKIAFPYTDLKDALSVADAIHSNAGTDCTVDQLAAYLGQSTTSGAFRLKLSTARIFGLIETGKGTVSLTELGREIVDPARREQAKASAFLAVALYSAVFDKYKGRPLPPPAGLQREMESLGVAKKQTQKARQAFERSAEQAGFFAHGKDRLVAPTVKASPPPPPPPPEDKKGKNGGGGGGDDSGGGGGRHPFIEGLLQTLPAPDSQWPSGERKKWLETAEHIFSLIYSDDTEVT